MLRLTDLTLTHFRSHLAARFAFDGRPVAIFGPNGAGKTNVLEAISLLSPGRGLRRAAAADMARRPDVLGWKVTALASAAGGLQEIETWSDGGAARQLRIDGKAAPQTALGHIARVLWLVPAMDRVWTEGADGRRRFLDRIALSFEPGHADVALHYEKAMRERNRLLKDMVREPAWYSALEARMAATGIVLDSNRRLALERIHAAQEGAATAFPAAELQLVHGDAPMPATEAEFRETLAAGRARDMAAGRTLAGPHRADVTGSYVAKEMPARDCSTGEQKALLVSLILANARALAAGGGAPPILLLDEVAAHLDEGRRAALYDEIDTLGAQAFMTGTEKSLFEALGSRAQYFRISDGDGVSRVEAG